ncbi:MAG: hypothetical protein ACSHX6_06735 [Akkermansiaceae bacterium]
MNLGWLCGVFVGVVVLCESKLLAQDGTALGEPSPALKMEAVLSSPRYMGMKQLAVDTKGGGLNKALPSKPETMCSAYGGAYVVLTFPELKKIGVFSMLTMTFVKYLPLPSERALLASGGNRLVVYDPVLGVFHVYDLDTFERVGSKISKVGKVVAIGMTSEQPDRGVIAWKDDEDLVQVGYLKIPSMEVEELRVVEGGKFSRDRLRSKEQVYLKVNEDFTQVVLWRGAGSYCRTQFYSIREGEILNYHSFSSMSPLSFTLDPAILVTGGGKIQTSDGKARGGRSKVTLQGAMTIQGTSLMVGLTRSHLEFYDTYRQNKLHAVELDKSGAKSRRSRSIKGFGSQYLVGSADAGRVALVDPDLLSIEVMEIPESVVKLAKEGEKSELARGKLWTRKLSYPEGSKVTLEHGPEDMKLDHDTGTLGWMVPSEQVEGEVLILITIKAPGAVESYEKIVLVLK